MKTAYDILKAIRKVQPAPKVISDRVRLNSDCVEVKIGF